MSDQTSPAAARRTAIKAALRSIANIADIADATTGKRNLSSLTMSELEQVAQAANLDLNTLPSTQAPAASVVVTPTKPAPAKTPAKPVPTVQPVQDEPTAPAVPDDVLDREVADILGQSLAAMPAAVRALALRAHTPRVVTVERVVTLPAVVPAMAPIADRARDTVAPVAIRQQANAVPVVQVVRTASASEVFGIKHPILARIQVLVCNDPDAPPVDPGYAFDADLLAQTLWRMSKNDPVLLSGAKGTGKTTFFEQIAAYLGRYFALLSFDRSTEIEPLIGQIELAGGATFWSDGALTRAMRRVGSIVLFDEPDMAKAGSLAALHPVLANKSILIPRTGERVDAAEHVYFAAAANTTGHGDQTGTYVDRQLLDAAFRDRFADILVIGYPAPAVERRILVGRTGISRAAAAMLVSFAVLSRQRADKQQDVAAGIGMRRLIAWASGLLSGLSPAVVFRSAILNQHNNEEAEVFWQLYKETVNEVELSAALDQVDPAGMSIEDENSEVTDAL